ncbi:MAG: biopolymer transporter ExbD [Alphaproteobacteria bacterium]|nr:biopolymer transporter ExbD [Alphaproteobacteria bacterium]MBQ3117333.1 biopolymer transporter ExbD [Alphaproteobacteria bacterium]MBQ6854515.1 biopolymer transporter ExbD [Alphaproteobacteria bacterium]MBQ8558278.1 biopolymer transporter ExbD [Alphaproteobacteria bacterium]MBR3913006.1 biopolymer transporter ExbD [Alphaproteobacteria bacterium]
MPRSIRKTKIRAEVNLTPLIDVMTSLLAIFMITAPLLTSGIPLNLPKGDGKQIEGQDKTLDISIDAKGQIYIGTDKVEKVGLIKKIQAIVAENPAIGMVISGDKDSAYGTVIEVMALLRSAGFTQVGLKTDAKVVMP